MDIPEIISPSNKRIKRLIGLRDRKTRDREGVLVAEGERLIQRALSNGAECLELYYVPGRFHPPPGLDAEVVSASEGALSRASYRGRSAGVLGVFRQTTRSLDTLRVGPSSLFLVLEGLEKPGNLGAILRTADAVGADGVLVAEPGTDLSNPNVVRASTGAVFSVPCVIAGLTELVDWLHTRRVPMFALDGDSPTSLWEADLVAPMALLAGAEDRGLTPEARAMADASMSIPMSGTSDSLNASVAIAVAAYETIRRRRRANVDGAAPTA